MLERKELAMKMRLAAIGLALVGVAICVAYEWNRHPSHSAPPGHGYLIIGMGVAIWLAAGKNK
jgi:hypothetical protein